jgi:hypothetical protein
MSASSFGFEELTFKELLPKLGLTFLLMNTSIFLIDWFIYMCNTFVHAVLSATGGLGQAWILNAFDPAALLGGQTALITLIFVFIFILLAAILLLFYLILVTRATFSLRTSRCTIALRTLHALSS